MKKFYIILAVLVIGLGTLFVSQYFDPGLLKGQSTFDTLDSSQKRLYWSYMRRCTPLLKAKKYTQYRQCASEAMKKTIEAKKEEAWCKDSDGVDFFTKGIVKTNENPEGIEDYSYTFGDGKSYLMEGQCDGNEYVYIQQNCEELDGNYVLGDGVCESLGGVIEIAIVDENGNPIPNTEVKAYDAPNYSDIDGLSPEESGFTDDNGKVDLKFSYDYNKSFIFVAKKNGYIGSFSLHVPINVDGIAYHQMILTTPPSKEELTGADISSDSFDKLRIETHGTFHVIMENEPHKYIYNLLLPPGESDKIAKIDSHMVITTSDEINTEFLYELTEEDIDIDGPQSFSLSLPQGQYGYYIYFDIEYNDGSTESYPKPYQNLQYYFLNGHVAQGLSYNFVVLPKMEYSTCNPFSSGQDNADPNKVNIMFINLGMDDDTFKKLTNEFVNGEFGVLNEEPFSSNKSALQFWFAEKGGSSDEFITPDTDIAYNLMHNESWNPDALTLDTLPHLSKVKYSCYLPNRQIVYVKNDNSLWGVKCVDGFISLYSGASDLEKCMEENTKSYCVNKIPYDAVFSHEFGHQFAALPEEYESDKLLIQSEYFSKMSYLQSQDSFNNYGIYYSPFIDPANDCVRQYSGTGNYICEANDKMIADCEANAKWKDLIGNGCGEDGVVDCDKSDPNQGLEVTCEYLGGGSVPFSFNFKPTRLSLMGNINSFSGIDSNQLLLDKSCNFDGKYVACDTSVQATNQLYNLVNQRQICKFIELYTGKSGGVCNKF